MTLLVYLKEIFQSHVCDDVGDAP